MVQAHLFFFALIKKCEVQIAVGNENRRAVGAFDLFHIQNGAVEIREALRVGSVERDVPDRDRRARIRHIKGSPAEADRVVVRVAELVVDAEERLAIYEVLLSWPEVRELLRG